MYDCGGGPCPNHGSKNTTRQYVAPSVWVRTYLFASAGKATSLAALMDWVDDPVNPGITTYLGR